MGSTAHGGDGTFSFNFFYELVIVNMCIFCLQSLLYSIQAITYITTYSFLQQCRDLFNFNWFHMLSTL